MKRQNLLILAFVVLLLVLGGGFFVYRDQDGSKVMVGDDKAVISKDLLKGYSAKVLAGKSSPFLEFNQEDYEKARESGKIVFLDFYANWCPICRGEAPELESGFNSLTTDSVVGFRVNYNDSDTDEGEKKLAGEFDITYQHTKVILKNREVVLKDGEVWDKNKFFEEINKAVQ